MRMIKTEDDTDTARKAAFTLDMSRGCGGSRSEPASRSDTTCQGFTYDALGRRIEFINDLLDTTTRYFYDGVNEIVETDELDARQRYYIHGISYVDERLMMHDEATDRPFYYVIDRMYTPTLHKSGRFSSGCRA